MSVALVPSATLLAAHLAGGILLGVLYFRGLWWNARLFATAGRTMPVIALMIGRFLLLACVLTLASLEGAMPLLVMSAGILLARIVVLRRLAGTPS